MPSGVRTKECESVLVDSDGHRHECAIKHDGRSRRVTALVHRAGAWYVQGDGRRVPVELRWGDPE